MSNNKPMAAGTFSRKALPTNYKGISFKSRSEAFWAVFFDACGVDWRYEEQGYNMGGVNYLPDFYLRDVIVRQNGDGDGEDLYVEVKGNMFGDDLEKITKFAGDIRNDIDAIFQNPILVVPSVPYGDTMTERERDAYRTWKRKAYYYNTCFIHCGEDHYSLPVIRYDGKLWITRGDYRWRMDEERTQRAYFIANKTSFEHGHTPTYTSVVEAMQSDDAAARYALAMQGEVKNDSKQGQKFTDAMKLFTERFPMYCKMLPKVQNGGTYGDVVTLLFNNTSRMIRPLLERHTVQMEQAFTEVYGRRMTVRMLDSGKTPTQAARSAIERSCDVFGRDKIELKEDD